MLTDAGHDAVHVRNYMAPTASDEAIMELARTQGRIMISADTDFGTLLARQGATTPSVLMVRPATSSNNGWQTRIGSFKFPSCRF